MRNKLMLPAKVQNKKVFYKRVGFWIKLILIFSIAYGVIPDDLKKLIISFIILI